MNSKNPESETLAKVMDALGKHLAWLQIYRKEVKTAFREDYPTFKRYLARLEKLHAKHVEQIRASESSTSKPELKIVESVHGTWAYHLSETGKTHEPTLCGKVSVMASNSKLETWNMPPTHLRYHFCAQCHALAVKAGYKVPAVTMNTLVF